MPNIKLADLIGQAQESGRNQPDTEKINKLMEYISNPISPVLDRNTLQQLTLSDWIVALQSYSNKMQSTVNKDLIDPDLKAEVQQMQLNAQKSKAADLYKIAITKVLNQLKIQRKELLQEIKSQKFPLYYGSATKSIGSMELQTALQTPLKYISAQLLKTFWDEKRTDLVSALLERFAINHLEFKIDEAQKITEFGIQFYEDIFVQPKRELLKYLDAFISLVEKHSAGGLWSTISMATVMHQNALQLELDRNSGWDTLIEA
jgi:hypothetical protein